MSKRLLSVVVFLCAMVCLPAFSIAEVPMKTTVIESSVVPELPEEYRDWRWHLVETPNFEILAIDLEDAEAMYHRVEALRSWGYHRWGFRDHQYAHKCMILCVPSQSVFQKWFRRANVDPRLTKSKRVDENTGEVVDQEVFAIWIAGEGDYLRSVLPEKIGRVNLMNYEKLTGNKLSKWAHVGMSALNNDVGTLRVMLSTFPLERTYKPSDVFGKDLPLVTPQAKADFRKRAAITCLMLRKLHGGSEQFMTFTLKASAGGPEKALAVYGFKGYDDFGPNYDRYIKNLSFDIRNDRTPDMGLTWFLPRKGTVLR